MLKKILFCFVFALPFLGFGQKMKRCVVAATTFSGQTTGVKIRATVAQPPNAGTDSNDGNSLRQGFQQPIPDALGCAVPSAAMTHLSTIVGCNESFSFFYTGDVVDSLEYLWDFGPDGVPQTSTSPNPTGVLFLNPGEHEVRLTISLDGCPSLAVSQITSNEKPLVATVNVQTDVSCNGQNDGAIELGVTGGEAPYVLNWSNGESSLQLSGLAGGNYAFSLMDANNCLFESSVEIVEPDAITLDIKAIPESCDNENDGSILATAIGGQAPYVYQWSNAAIGATNEALTKGEYDLVIFDANGCSAEQRGIEITVLCNEEVNNFVTPNGDGFNDIWILPTNFYDRIGIKIYNRYGGIVYENSDYQNDWSGENTAGDPLPAGAYFFALDFEKAGEVVVEKGSLTLLR